MAGYNPAAPYGHHPGQGQAPPNRSYQNQPPVNYGGQQSMNANTTNQSAFSSNNNNNTTGTFPLPNMQFPPPLPLPPFNGAVAPGGQQFNMDWMMQYLPNAQQLPATPPAWPPIPPPGFNGASAYGNNAAFGAAFNPANLPYPIPPPQNTTNFTSTIHQPPQLSQQSTSQNITGTSGINIPGLGLQSQPVNLDQPAQPVAPQEKINMALSEDGETSDRDDGFRRPESRNEPDSNYRPNSRNERRSQIKEISRPNSRNDARYRSHKSSSGRSSRQHSPRVAREYVRDHKISKNSGSAKFDSTRTRTHADTYRPNQGRGQEQRPDLFARNPPRSPPPRSPRYNNHNNGGHSSYNSGRRSSDNYNSSNMGNFISRAFTPRRPATPRDEVVLDYSESRDHPLPSPRNDQVTVNDSQRRAELLPSPRIDQVTVNNFHGRAELPPSPKTDQIISNDSSKGVDPLQNSTNDLVTPAATPDKIVSDAYREAENVVLNLLKFGLTFEDFIAHGVAEDILRKVFDAAGAYAPPPKQPKKDDGPVPALAKTFPKDVPTGPRNPTAPTGPRASKAAKTEEFLKATRPKPGETTVSPAVPSFGSAPVVATKPATATSKAPSSSLAKPASIPKVVEKQANSTADSRKPIATAVDPSTTKGEERKDRIARLLEAKSKKAEKPAQPAPVAKASETTQPSIAKPTLDAAQVSIAKPTLQPSALIEPKVAADAPKSLHLDASKPLVMRPISPLDKTTLSQDILTGHVLNVSEAISNSVLKEALEKYGKLKFFTINRQTRLATVTFDSPPAFQAALAGNPHKVAGQLVVLEPAKPNHRNNGRGRGGLPAKPVLTPQQSMTPVNSSTEAPKVDKSEILKQRMQALLQERREKAAADAEYEKSRQLFQQPQSPYQSSGNQSPIYPQAYSPSASQFQVYPAQPAMPPIPGLFLANNNMAQYQQPFQQFMPYQNPPQFQQNQDPVVVNPRRRPVASDFDGLGSTEQPPQKKPFGYCPPDRLRIEVSDDEEEDDDDNGMDADDSNNDMYGFSSNARGPQKSLRDSQPLSDVRRSFKPTSAVATPPVVQGNGRPAARPEDLKEKELEIERMRRKIAEAEKRSKLRVSSDTQPSTPNIYSSNNSSLDVAGKSLQMARRLGEVDREIAAGTQMLAEVQHIAENKSDVLKQIQDQDRSERQAQLSAEQPVLNENVLEMQQRLVAMRKEMEKLDVELQNKTAEKARVENEIRQLAADQELARQRQRLDALNSANAAAGDAGTGEAAQTADGDTTTLDAPASVGQASIENAQASVERQSSPDGTIAAPLPSHTEAEEPAPSVSQVQTPAVTTSAAKPAPLQSIEAASHQLEASTSEEDTPMIESSASSRNTTSSADPGVNSALEATSPDNEDASMEGTDSDSSAAMDMGRDSSAIASPACAATEESDSSSSVSVSDSSEEGEVSESDDNDDAGAGAAGGSGNASADAGASEDDDVLMGESDDSQPSQQSSIGASAPATGAAESMSPDVPVPPSQLASSAASAAQAEPKELARSHTHREIIDLTQPEHQAKYFTSYDSPLKQFHAYRFHPEFKKQVAGGYKSLTYSHNIQPKEELCRYEMAGGTCNDMTCMLQHWRDVGLAGASNPLEDMDEKKDSESKVDATINTDFLSKMSKPKSGYSIFAATASLPPGVLPPNTRIQTLEEWEGGEIN